METKIYCPSAENLSKCARIIKNGELVAFPTETVYGLGANALSRESVKKIYAAKGRPSDNPLIVHIAKKDDVFTLASEVPEKALVVMERFMPGPVTIVLPKKNIVPDETTGGLGTVAIRMPASEIARTLIIESGCPICAPSANTSTKPSPTCAAHVFDDLNGKIPAIIDGGECSVGVESTVIDFCGGKVRLLRAGGMPIEELETAIGKIEVVRSSAVALCPGMKYKHYAPKAEVFVAALGGDIDRRMIEFYEKAVSDGKKPVIVAMNAEKRFGGKALFSAGKDYADYARVLFALLRKSDDDGYDTVICEGVSDEGMGRSVANRLSKASGGKTI